MLLCLAAKSSIRELLQEVICDVFSKVNQKNNCFRIISTVIKKTAKAQKAPLFSLEHCNIYEH